MSKIEIAGLNLFMIASAPVKVNRFSVLGGVHFVPEISLNRACKGVILFELRVSCHAVGQR